MHRHRADNDIWEWASASIRKKLHEPSWDQEHAVYFLYLDGRRFLRRAIDCAVPTGIQHRRLAFTARIHLYTGTLLGTLGTEGTRKTFSPDLPMHSLHAMGRSGVCLPPLCLGAIRYTHLLVIAKYTPLHTQQVFYVSTNTFGHASSSQNASTVPSNTRLRPPNGNIVSI